MTTQSNAIERVGVVVIHGVGGAKPGWVNQEVIPHLVKNDPGLKFEDHSEVHELKARPHSAWLDAKTHKHTGEPFSSYLRRAGYGHGRNIVFMELYWADLAQIGQGWMSAFFTLLQVFYEAPLVLSAAFMRRRQTGLRRLLARLIRIANWLLRWPISGLNTSVFFAALALWAVEGLRERWPKSILFSQHDAYYVCAALLVIAAVAIRMTRRDDDKNILRSELAPSTATSAVVLMVALAIADQFAAPQHLTGLASYLLLASVPILLFWLLWSHVVVAGVVLVGAVWIRHIIAPDPWRGTPMRPAAALGLTMIQGVIWKIIIALTWAIMITTLAPGSLEASACGWVERASCRDLGKLLTELVIIVSLNLAMAGLLAITVLGVFAARRFLVKRKLDAIQRGDLTLPRLIISRPAVSLMFVLTVANFMIFYGPAYLAAISSLLGYATGPRMNIVNVAQPLLADYRYALSATWLTIMAVLAFVILTSSLNGVLHIVRDLVNHQYIWRKTSTSKWTFRSPWSQVSFGIGVGSFEEEHPRRARIMERLDTLMREIVSRENCQRLVLVGHSQGSVILYDYLRSKWDDVTLASIERIDIITLGSPLGHIYQNYFPDYEQQVPYASELNPKLRSWTNLWRADDPIGHRLDIVGGGFIDNIALPAGGHVDYWRDNTVSRVILTVCDPDALWHRTYPSTNGGVLPPSMPPPVPTATAVA